jgi:hypothetical protein
VQVEGKPNLFKRRGRPRSVFAPKSARIARVMLIEAERAFTQRELAKAVGLDEGFTSRIVLYVGQLLTEQARQEMGFREESRGENVWLVLPNDEGVFHGATERDGVRCVHPIQVYLDLRNHPERSTEAAEHLRKWVLKKGGNA